MATAATPEALVAGGIDALVIATPTPSHAPMIRLVAEASNTGPAKGRQGHNHILL